MITAESKNNIERFLRYFVIIFFIIAYLLPLSWRPMMTPDEFRYGQIPRTMLQENNFVVPELLDVKYFEKPALGYQLTAWSMKFFGENAFANRLPSALGAGLTALLIYFLISSYRKEKMAALLSSLFYLGFGLVYGIGTFAVLDSQFTAFVTGCIVTFFIAYNAPKIWSKLILLALCGIFCGLAFQTKGFLAVLVPGIVIFPFLCIRKDFKAMVFLGWIPLFFAILCALPWSWAIHQQEPTFWHTFFWEEHYQRFFDKTPGQHPEPFWFFLPFLFLGTLPMLLFLPAVCGGFAGKVKKLCKDELFQFLICYIFFPFIFFSLSSGKLATYILPCFVPLAAVMGIGMSFFIEENYAGKCQKIQNIVLQVIAVILMVGAIGFGLYQVVGTKLNLPTLYAPDELLNWSLCLMVILIWGLFLWRSRNESIFVKMMIFMGGMLLLLPCGNNAVPHRVLEGKAQGEALIQLVQIIPADAVVVVHPNAMHAAAWVLNRNDLYFLVHGGELSKRLKEDPVNVARIIELSKFKNFIDQYPAGKVFFIMRGKYDEYIPKDVIVQKDILLDNMRLVQF